MIALQVKNAIGDGLVDAAIIDPKKLSNLQTFNKFITEYVTTDQSVRLDVLRDIVAQ